MYVFEAASDGEQGVAVRYRPAAPRPFESAADNGPAGVFTTPEPPDNQRTPRPPILANTAPYLDFETYVSCVVTVMMPSTARAHMRGACRSRATPEPIHAEPCRP